MGEAKGRTWAAGRMDLFRDREGTASAFPLLFPLPLLFHKEGEAQQAAAGPVPSQGD